MSKVTLKAVDTENIEECLSLQIQKEQEIFVASTEKSLAYAYVHRDQCQPFAIYASDKIVGYVLTIFDQEDDLYCIWHMLIDAENQGHGYGTAALQLVLDYFQSFPFGKAESIGLTCHENNEAGLCLYRRLEFKETGEKDADNELILTRPIFL